MKLRPLVELGQFQVSHRNLPVRWVESCVGCTRPTGCMLSSHQVGCFKV